MACTRFPLLCALGMGLFAAGLPAAALPDHQDGIPDDTVMFNAGGGVHGRLWTMSHTRLPPLPFYSGDFAAGGFTFFNDPSMIPSANRTMVGDIDGDGLDDIVEVDDRYGNGSYVSAAGLTGPSSAPSGLSIAPAGITWVTPFGPAEPGTTANVPLLADFNGDGITDIANNDVFGLAGDIFLLGDVIGGGGSPVGACCLPHGACAPLTEEDCTAHTGRYHGDRTGCASIRCCSDPFADADGDGDVDQEDFARFQVCITGPGGGVPAGCACFDRDNAGTGDGDIDRDDFPAFANCTSGPTVPANPACDG